MAKTSSHSHVHIGISHDLRVEVTGGRKLRTYKNRVACNTNYEPGSSVSIVSGYGLDDRAIEVRSPAEAKRFFL
jgi:hypothetical protein